jgi:flagellar basal body-associated protein FliL
MTSPKRKSRRALWIILAVVAAFLALCCVASTTSLLVTPGKATPAGTQGP